MIFLTVGTQEPFDRLSRAVDEWAATHDVPVFGQLGGLGPQSYRPRHFEWREFISADEYQLRLENCRLLVAHAGMGSIISALSWGKPLLMLARKASLGEHRNEHQHATAEKFRHRAGIYVVDSETEIAPAIDRLLASETTTGSTLSAEASPELIATLRQFIHAGHG